MARKTKEMSALGVSRLRDPGLHFVGGVSGLALQVTPSGARSWILRVMIGGKRRDMGLGGFPDVTLAGARDAARVARAKIKAGIDPIEEGRAARSMLAASRASALSFQQCATAYMAVKQLEWKNDKHAKQWSSTLETYAYPVIGKMLVRDIEQEHVLRVLEPIWSEKTETASRLRGRMESILDWARVRGYRKGDNPARWKGHLDTLLANPGKIAKTRHHAALPYKEIGAAMAELREVNGMGARALEFTILTAARSGETRGAVWQEIDLEAGVWTIPPDRMKMKKEHRIPLSREAVAILEALPRLGDTDLVFTGTRGRPLSDATMTAVLRRMGSDVTVHGFRSTFRDWASECTSYPHEVCEMALAHTIPNKAEAAYRRGDLFEKRARLMRDWAKFCGTVAKAATVTPIRSKAAA